MEAIGEVLKRVLRFPGALKRLKAWSVLSDWEKVVGRDVARRCRPVAYERETLTLAVEDPIWATALKYESQNILKLLNEAAEEPLFKEVRFVVRPRRTKRLYKKTKLSLKDQKLLSKVTESLEDPELKEAFGAWMRVVLQRKKSSPK